MGGRSFDLCTSENPEPRPKGRIQGVGSEEQDYMLNNEEYIGPGQNLLEEKPENP